MSGSLEAQPDPAQPPVMVALNADIVGYSRLLADDPDATSAAMAAYRRLVESAVAAGPGTLASFVGDNFMAIFHDPANAMQTAIAISGEVEARNADLPEASWVRFRMGLDIGPITHIAGDYQGDALNIAARIQALARPGGVSVSGRVYQALDEPALRFRPAGRRTLKNIPGAVDVYDFADLPSSGPAPREHLALEIPTLAVLPIHTESVAESLRPVASILRGDLVHRLAAIPELGVIDAHAPVGTDHVESSARYMLETGLHQVGRDVRVYATLFDVTTWNVVKSHKWATTEDEVLQLTERVAEEVAHSVEIELIVGAPAGLYAELDDPAAIEKVYLGWYHLRTDTKEGWTRAIELFGEVAESHPDRPYGFVLSAFAYWIGASNRWVPDEDAALEKARTLALRAKEIGDPTGMSQAVDAAVLMSMGEVDAAVAALDRVEILRPTCDVTYGLEGSLCRYLGQWQKAVDLLDVAMRLTGINKPWYPTVKAASLFVGAQFEDAAAVAEEVLNYQPHNLEALLVLAAAQSELGLARRAGATAELIRQRFPSVDVGAWLDRNPYQLTDIVARWKSDLVAAGVITAG